MYSTIGLWTSTLYLSVLCTYQDGVFSFVAVTCFVASALASAVYAAAWGEPPEVCDRNGHYYMYNDCDHQHLEGTNGTAAVSYL